MTGAIKTVEEFIESLPDTVAIRAKLAENLREQDMLEQMLKLAEQRKGVREVREVRPMTGRRTRNT